jgi:type I restriction enzyme S subunit
MKTLGEIAKYRRGSFPQPYGNREWYDGEGAMPFVQVADVEEYGRKLKDRTKQYISTLAMPKSVYAPKGTVIVTLQGSIGKVAITQYDSYIDRTLGIFEGYRIDIDKIYFALQLEKIFSIKKEKARGGTIKTITKEEFTNFLIPVPSLIRQKLIVDILDKFEASIQNLEDQLSQREKQYEYYRYKLLTFE